MTLRIEYSIFRNHPLTCLVCGWEGTGKEAAQNAGGMVMDLECPKCFKMLAIITFPTYQQTLAGGGEADRQAVLREINFRERFRRMSLKSPDELPNIQGNPLRFSFKAVTIKGEDYSIVEYQGREIWREPLVWEGYARFMEIGRIMKEKYGSRMDDLAPDETALTFLYGDKPGGPALIDECRKKLKSPLAF